ncbi:MAG: [FeFe] hydrogenase H-cluster radical SAM maturase HydE [Lachnospiraceae bacterium]|nr:[FeFe] hydrogenase H-cluster radical SAM maturase HydE [Lachnospiraceae bacterium]
MSTRHLIERLEQSGVLSKEEFVELISTSADEDKEYAKQRARDIGDAYFGKKIYVRGLIEFTNYCKNDCLYCGIRRSNGNAERYRLTEEEILSCCEEGEQLGFRTFVLQGGEDAYYTDERMVELIHKIKERHPDCALTLSIGERERESYEKFFRAGADRYLLRHETASDSHYRQLHPSEMSLAHRKNCLRQLKEIGFQTGCGFMVGSPGQTAETLAEDFLFIHELQPEMVGIGPFIPHQDTQFANEAQGALEQTLFLLSLLRIMQKDLLLPATTALATIHPTGREQGILAGANVLMPNLSPVNVRDKYSLYDGKVCTGDEAAECRNCLQRRVEGIGYEIVVERGDHPSRH